MPDIVDSRTRSRMMAGIRGTDTKPELAIRKGLHAAGFRFRVHKASLPGKPDLSLARYRAVIFVNGCFWHGHDCHLFRMPSTRTDFWKAKIGRNQERDLQVCRLLEEINWRSLVIWECALKGRNRLEFDDVIARAASWLISENGNGVIAGSA